jgi:hypothetical protein
LLYDITMTNYAGRLDGFFGVNDSNPTSYRYGDYKLYDTGSFVWGLKNIANWPYGDIIVTDFNVEETSVFNMMSTNADSFLTKSLGDNVWGGSTFEVIYSDRAP